MRPPRNIVPIFGSSTPAVFDLPPQLRVALFRTSLLPRQLSTSRAAFQTATPPPQETYIPAPREGSGPLLERLPNRELPDFAPPSRTWLKTLPIFVFLITISSLAIFNYQKSTSSTVNSILYALRVSPAARDLLGDEIYFASKVPWISGTMNQLHGIIDISFWVKGTNGQGKTKFRSTRKHKDGYFETTEWSLTMEDGKVVQLLDQGERDPMHGRV
jgi:cytochrome c oxidase assembly factor 1